MPSSGGTARQRQMTAALATLVTASYFVAAQVGFELAFLAEQVTTVWAPTGIGIAALLLGGIRLWPAVWVGAFLANAVTGAPLWTAPAIASGNTLEALTAAWLIRRQMQFDVRFDRVTGVLAFIAIAAGVAATISATIGVTTLCAAAVQPWARFPWLWLDWWLGDALGAVVVAPALLTTLHRGWSRHQVRDTALFVVASLTVTHLVFRLPAGSVVHPLEFVVFPVAIAASVIGGPAATSLAVASTSVVAIWHTAAGAGPFAGPDVHQSLVLLQVFMGVLAATALLLAAAVSERRSTEHLATGTAEALRHRDEMLRLAQRAGGVATFVWDFRNGVAACSEEFFRIVGLPPQDGPMTTAEWRAFVHPDDRERMTTHLTRVFAGEESAATDYRINAADGSVRWLSYTGLLQQTSDGDRMFGTVVDITDRKRLEVELRQHGEQLEAANRELRRRVLEQQTLLDVLPIGIGIADDRECRRIRTNRAFAATLGLPPDSNASKTAPESERPTNFRVLTPDGREVPGDQLPLQVAAREGKEIHALEFDVQHADGRVVRLLEYAAPLRDEHGQPHGAVGAFVDVTAAHLARATLARSEERYRRIFDTAGVSLWEQDFTPVKAALDRLAEAGVEDVAAYLANHPHVVDECAAAIRVIDVNDATLRMFDAPDKQALVITPERIFGTATRDMCAGVLVALSHGRRRYEAEAALRAWDGRPVHVLLTVTVGEAGDVFDSVLVSLADITARNAAETALRQEVEMRSALAQVGASLAGELRSEALVQAVTDAATKLTEAEFGAFFYNVVDETGGGYSLYSLAGAPKEAFASLPHPRATEIFAPTFRGEANVRLDDVTRDRRFGQNPPFYGMPEGHLPVRSYLAVPVVGRDGTVLGGLFFGHSRPAVFTERHEMLASGVAAWAAIALDNARLYQDIEQANRLKDEFLATLSHELRTPLNAVLGWAHMLRGGAVDPSMHQKALEALERNARAQAQLVEDLLDVSRIIAGKLQIKADPVDLGPIVADAVDTVRAGVTAKALTLQVHLPTESRILVTGDADRLQQVVWNLVSNAVKFTPSGGRVDVELRHVGDTAEIVVRDTGQGIAPSFQPLLFQRFRQVDASKTRVHGGLGLGLSIVRHLTEAHGGTVSAESEGVGHGATFRVRLPLRAVVSLSAPRGYPVPPSPTDVLSGIAVLVVDDDADTRELMRYVLEDRGAEVATAASAGEALHLLAGVHYGVLVADIGMPEQDGLELIQLVRELPPTAVNREIPAIAVTAYASVAEREEALGAGFGWHLGKPVDPEQLVLAVAAASRREGS